MSRKIKLPKSFEGSGSLSLIVSASFVAGIVEWLLIYQIHNPLNILIISICGTSLWTFGWMFALPEPFKTSLRGVAFSFYGVSSGDVVEKERAIGLFLKKIQYKRHTLKSGVYVALFPWLIYMICQIELPKTWELFYRPRPPLVLVLFAVMVQTIFSMPVIPAIMVFRFPSHWKKVFEFGDHA